MEGQIESWRIRRAGAKRVEPVEVGPVEELEGIVESVDDLATAGPEEETSYEVSSGDEITFQEVQPVYTLSTEQVEEAVDKVLEFCCVATETTLYPYQRAFARRIVQSLLQEDVAEITGLFSRQSGKCLAPETPVLRFDGTVVRADQVRPGDLLMGPDSRARTVVSTCRGREAMYEIRPRNNYHEPYRVNESHILTLKRHDGTVVDVPLREVTDPELYEGFTVPVQYPKVPVPHCPYGVGKALVQRSLLPEHLWLGDRIPKTYLINDDSVRAQVLAGMVDWGALPHRHDTAKLRFLTEPLAEDVVCLAKSLGFAARKVEREDGWAVLIRGALGRLPLQLVDTHYSCTCDAPLSYKFDIVRLGQGDYAGFTLEGPDHRFLLGNYTVTHNTEAAATVATGCLIILPKLAQIEPFSTDDRFKKFAKGFWVGLFAPSKETAAILHQRMKLKMRTEAMREVCNDPEIDLPLPEKGSVFLNMANGSLVSQNTANPQASIEGRTYHLMICDESQDIDDFVLFKSIHPMGAATSATMVKIGTTNQKPSAFYRTCRSNKRKMLEGGRQDHYEYNYLEVQKWNPRYRKYVAAEMDRLGPDSEEFRMSYGLEWMMDQGLFIEEHLFVKCGVEKRHALRRRNGPSYLTFSRYDNLVTYDSKQRDRRFYDIAAIDIGRDNDSTVVTIGRVWWEAPMTVAGRARHYIHIMNWYEIEGYDHEKQYAMLLQFLTNYQLSAIVVDASGRGDPVYDRLKADLESNALQHEKITVLPFIFNLQSKHMGYALYREELLSGRFTYPASATAKRSRKWRRFRQQHFDLERSWKGKWMQVHAPTRKGRGKDKPKDDYCDSAMLLCWLANEGFVKQAVNEDDVDQNPFYERESRRNWFSQR